MSRRLMAAILVSAAALSAATTGEAQAPEAAFAVVEPVPVPTERSLLSVSFPDPMHGYAVGGFGVIVATSDGGATWHKQDSGVESTFTRTSTPDRDDPAETGLRSVYFVDAQHGWAVGDPALILSTTDGGQRWVRQTPPDVSSIPTSSRSEDAGKIFAFSDVVFTDTKSGYIVGGRGTILTTTDGGQTWEWRGEDRFGSLKGVAFPDPRSGRAVGEAGGEQGQFVIIATEDGGRTWRMQSQRNPDADVPLSNFDAVNFVDPLRGHVVGAAGRILATTDGGQRWSVQRKDTTERFRGVAFADAKRGVAVGATEFTDRQQASIVATADGGETWVPRRVQGVTLWDVTFATPTTAYAVGCQEFGDRARLDQVTGQRNTCLRSLVVRITFPGGGSGAGGDSGGSGGGGGFPLPVLIGAAAVVAVMSGVLIARRRH